MKTAGNTVNETVPDNTTSPRMVSREQGSITVE